MTKKRLGVALNTFELEENIGKFKKEEAGEVTTKKQAKKPAKQAKAKPKAGKGKQGG